MDRSADGRFRPANLAELIEASVRLAWPMLWGRCMIMASLGLIAGVLLVRWIRCHGEVIAMDEPQCPPLLTAEQMLADHKRRREAPTLLNYANRFDDAAEFHRGEVRAMKDQEMGVTFCRELALSLLKNCGPERWRRTGPETGAATS